ncbi:unnamed protein product, partial [Didymodactylos carnosus]
MGEIESGSEDDDKPYDPLETPE